MGCGSSTDTVTDANKFGNGVGELHSSRRQEIEAIELTEGVVQQYVQIQKEIHRLEDKEVVLKYEEKVLHADSLKKDVDQLEATCKELKKQSDKKKSDLENLEQPSVKKFLKDQGTFDQKFSKEQQEYREYVSKHEVAESTLEHSRSEYERAAKIAEVCKRRVDKLNDLYDKEDHLLAGIFDGKYGSDVENRLEGQLDEVLDWHHRVALAKFKWSNGRVLLVHACTQMAFGVKRWQELETIELNNTRARYFAAAEARNNFVAASQNIQSCRVYLGSIQFPYCTEDQMGQLERFINSAFTDVQAQDRYQKAVSVYQMVHREVSSLTQWFDQVIAETILKDYATATEDVGRTQRELRTERLRLMKEKVQQKFGYELVINYDPPSKELDEDEKELLALESQQPGTYQSNGRLNNLLSLTQPDGRMPTGQLAPLPSNDSLFGNVADIKKKYDEERRELEKQQEAAKAKMDQGLQEKLRQRRIRRDRRAKSAKLDAETIKPK